MPPAPESAPSEVELKFQLGPDSLKLLRASPIFARGAQRLHLNTVYYDTPDCDLRDGGMSLRVRESEGRFVQTVKSRNGASLFNRNEWETDLGDARPDTDLLDGTPAGQVLDPGIQRRLSAIFTTRVERTVQDCRHDGSIVEMSLDEGEIIAGDLREPICELELELKHGNPNALFELARALGGETALRLSFETKSERGYRLAGRDSTKALKAERTEIKPDTTAGDAFRRVARSCLTQISGNAERLLAVRSPDALHQLRVGLRRLRAAFDAFRSVVADDEFARLQVETKWLSTSLNEARDLDVFMRSIAPASEDSVDDDVSMAAFRQRLIRRQGKAYDAVLAAIASSRFDHLLLDVAAWAEAGEWATSTAKRFARPRSEPANALARRILTHLRKSALKKGRGLGQLDEAQRHKVRIKVKKLRYAADFFAAAVAHPRNKRKDDFINQLRALQDCLGELNDLTTAHRTAMSVVQEPGGAGAGFAAGLVIGRREAQEPVLLAAAVTAFDSFARAKAFW